MYSSRNYPYLPPALKRSLQIQRDGESGLKNQTSEEHMKQGEGGGGGYLIWKGMNILMITCVHYTCVYYISSCHWQAMIPENIIYIHSHTTSGFLEFWREGGGPAGWNSEGKGRPLQLEFQMNRVFFKFSLCCLF